MTLKTISYDVLQKQSNNRYISNLIISYQTDKQITSKYTRTANMNYAAYVANMHLKLFSK